MHTAGTAVWTELGAASAADAPEGGAGQMCVPRRTQLNSANGPCARRIAAGDPRRPRLIVDWIPGDEKEESLGDAVLVYVRLGFPALDVH